MLSLISVLFYIQSSSAQADGPESDNSRYCSDKDAYLQPHYADSLCTNLVGSILGNCYCRFCTKKGETYCIDAKEEHVGFDKCKPYEVDAVQQCIEDSRDAKQMMLIAIVSSLGVMFVCTFIGCIYWRRDEINCCRKRVLKICVDAEDENVFKL